MCISNLPNSIQSGYTSIRVDLQVYNSLLSTKKILEQAYKQKFSLSETIQVVNQLSYDQIQKISSKRRELDEMLDGRGKLASKEVDHPTSKTRESVRGSVP